jgi:hypothetical protein
LKKAWTLLLLSVLLMTVLVVSGCGSENNTEEPVEDNIVVEKSPEGGQGGKVTVEGESGETTYEVGEEIIPTEAELGAPLYPGAQYVAGSAIPAKITTADGEVTLIKAEFTTAKAKDLIVKWYTSRLGEPPGIEEGETYWVYGNEAGDKIIVSVKAEGNGAKITIRKMSGEIGPNY